MWQGRTITEQRDAIKRATRRGLIPANPAGDVEWHGAQCVDNVDPFTGKELRAEVVRCRA